jgi:hypothetical protein
VRTWLEVGVKLNTLAVGEADKLGPRWVDDGRDWAAVVLV